MKKISVSYLGQTNVKEVLKKLDKTDVDYIHVDVMDGEYVSNRVNTFNEVNGIYKYTSKPLDIHFMVKNPLSWIDDYAQLSVKYMSFQVNCEDNLNSIINKCHQYGIGVGLVINPDEDIDLLYPYLSEIDLVLIMSVVPGLPGQELIKEVIPKITQLREKINQKNLNTKISVDGGIKDYNANLLNADILVSGSFITNSLNYQMAITSLRN